MLSKVREYIAVAVFISLAMFPLLIIGLPLFIFESLDIDPAGWIVIIFYGIPVSFGFLYVASKYGDKYQKLINVITKWISGNK